MKTTPIIATISAFFAMGVVDTASAKCYGSGVSWANKNESRYHVGRACSGHDGKPGAMQGIFEPNEIKYFCIQHSDNHKFEFWISNLSPMDAFDLEDIHCTFGLWNEIDGCERGGETDSFGWRFRSDPNEGRC